jgi:hypothetical protein
MYGFGVVSNSITFIPTFVEIRPVVLEMKLWSGTYWHMEVGQAWLSLHAFISCTLQRAHYQMVTVVLYDYSLTKWEVTPSPQQDYFLWTSHVKNVLAHLLQIIFVGLDFINITCIFQAHVLNLQLHETCHNLYSSLNTVKMVRPRLLTMGWTCY